MASSVHAASSHSVHAPTRRPSSGHHARATAHATPVVHRTMPAPAASPASPAGADLPVWVDKATVPRCENEKCRREFSLLVCHRQHCRSCGRIFCADCVTTHVLSQPRVFRDAKTGQLMPPVAGKQKVCKRCFAHIHSEELNAERAAQMATPTATATPSSSTNGHTHFSHSPLPAPQFDEGATALVTRSSSMITRSMSARMVQATSSSPAVTSTTMTVDGPAQKFASALADLQQSAGVDPHGSMVSLQSLRSLVGSGRLALPQPWHSLTSVLSFLAHPSFVELPPAGQLLAMELMHFLALSTVATEGPGTVVFASGLREQIAQLENLSRWVRDERRCLRGVRGHAAYLVSLTGHILALVQHSDSKVTHTSLHIRHLAFTCLAFFGLGDAPLASMFDAFWDWCASLRRKAAATQVVGEVMQVMALVPKRTDDLAELERQLYRAQTQCAEAMQSVTGRWEVRVTYLELLKRFLQILAQPASASSSPSHAADRERLCLAVLYGLPSSTAPGHTLPGLLSSRSFSRLLASDCWRVREKVVAVCLELVVSAAAGGASSTYPPSVLQACEDLLLERQLVERDAHVLETLHARDDLRAIRDALAATWQRRRTDVEQMMDALGAEAREGQQRLETLVSAKADREQVQQVQSGVTAALASLRHVRVRLDWLGGAVQELRAGVHEVAARQDRALARLEEQAQKLARLEEAAGYLVDSMQRVDANVASIASHTSATHEELRRLRGEVQALRKSNEFTHALLQQVVARSPSPALAAQPGEPGAAAVSASPPVAAAASTPTSSTRRASFPSSPAVQSRSRIPVLVSSALPSPRSAPVVPATPRTPAAATVPMSDTGVSPQRGLKRKGAPGTIVAVDQSSDEPMAKRTKLPAATSIPPPGAHQRRTTR